MKVRGACVWMVVAACAPAAAAGPREGVSETLDRMAHDALAGDAGAYLGNVDGRDPVWLKEQANWAADLKRLAPAVLSFNIGESEGIQPAHPDSPSRAVFPLTIVWSINPSGTDGKPVERTVSFPAAFEREAPSGRWLYGGEDWLVLESPADRPEFERVRVKFMAGSEETARGVVGILPDVRRAVHGMFGLTVGRVQEVKLYPDVAHLQASIYLSYSDPLTGWNEPGESIKLAVPAGTNAEGLRRLLAHEYAHVATFEMGERASDMPWWALEGVAELAAERIGGGGGSGELVEKWAREGSLIAWDDLADFHGAARANGGHVYAQGWHMVAFIATSLGEDVRNRWLRALSNGAPLESATVGQLGVSFAELDRRWRESLYAKP